MLISVLKSKLAYGRVTEAQLYYEGSITIDVNLMKAADLIPGERVTVLNVNNGQRFDTYTIEGEPGSGTICLNGPAARLGLVGDEVVILSYVLLSPEEGRVFRPKIFHLKSDNTIQSDLS